MEYEGWAVLEVPQPQPTFFLLPSLPTISFSIYHYHSYQVVHPGEVTTNRRQGTCINFSRINILPSSHSPVSTSPVFTFSRINILPSHILPSHILPSQLLPSQLLPCHILPYQLIPSHILPLCHTLPSPLLASPAQRQCNTKQTTRHLATSPVY
jgi:hypothetical protein